MEDWKKKYEEIIKRVKELHESDNALTKLQMEVICPELKESEDEKIRKWLINLIDKMSFEFDEPLRNGETWRQKVLAYLEKQKEQNDEDKESTDFTIYHPLKNGKGKYECIPYSFYGSLTSFSEDKDLIDFLHTSFYTEEECEEWLEKQKEQKPTLNWRTIEQATTKRTDEGDCVTTEKMLIKGLIDDEDYRIIDKDVMVNKNLLCIPVSELNAKEQQLAEWSDDDEAIAYLILKELEQNKKNSPDYSRHFVRLIDWFTLRFKSLRPQSKQEWSEEDEKMLRTIISDGSRCVELDSKQITWLKSLRPQPKKELSIEKAIQWLDDTFCFLDNSSGRGRDYEITTHNFDSLEEMYDSFRKAVTVDSQPHWKPSEEQMEALRWAINYLTDIEQGCASTLALLKFDLKKLN